MSTATRTKSKDKTAGKEPPNVSSKPSNHVNTSVGIPATGYNPLLGTFHTFNTSPIPSTSPLHVNGRFQNINDTDDHNGNGIEYDTASNNDSSSGESEDHKDKTSQTKPRQESVPGANNDKREKIRQKNEKKHQRQKERRAQELHVKCRGYLMSRKLEALAQQLVAMGFSQERATMALILNEGKVEESVSWLFDCSEEDNKHRYKVSKQDVERAVVASEGDLYKAEGTLKEHKQEPIKPEETGDPPTLANDKLPIAINQNTINSIPPTLMQQERDERDFNYTKPPVTVMGSSVHLGTKNMQALNKIPPKPEWSKPQHITVPTDKRWTNTGSNNPSVSYSLQASSTPTKTGARFIGNEMKNLQLGSIKEPVIVMQRPQFVNQKQIPSSSFASSPPGMTTNCYSNSNAETVKANGLVPPVAVSRSFSSNGVGLNPMYNQLHYQSQQFVPSSSSGMESQGGNGLWSRGGVSHTIAPASNLGLFSGLGANWSSGSNSLVDWSTDRSMLHTDYSSIDWSLDRGSLTSMANGGLTNGSYSMQNNAQTFDSFAYGSGVKSATRPILSVRNGGPGLSLPDEVASMEATAGGSREWSSPFEEKDIFSLPRQFVSSPSL